MSNSIPLTPKDRGGVCVAASILQPADIIICTHAGFKPWVIRNVTLSEVSHALVYIGSSQIIEAVPPKVRQANVDAALADDTVAVVYRRKNMGPGQVQSVIAYLRRQIGADYDTLGAGGAGIHSNLAACAVAGIILCVAANEGLLASSKRFFCSELVLAAFREAGRPITNTHPNLSTPNTIVQAYSSGVLDYIGHIKP